MIRPARPTLADVPLADLCFVVFPFQLTREVPVMRTWNIVFCPVIALIGFSSVYGESKYERLVFDVTSQKQAIDGFGAFIWPNDQAIPILFRSIGDFCG